VGAANVDLEQIIQQILMVRHDLSREDVLKKIIDKKRSAEDYFLDDVAARIVASELGVEIQNSDQDRFNMEIAVKDLVTGLNDVTITGRIIIIYPTQTFHRANLTEGKVARLLLADKTGSLRLVIWDDKISILESGKITPGKIIRVLHAYVREAIDGKIELHLGRKGDIQVSPPDVIESDYPQISDFINKIADLRAQRKRASVQGLVTEAFPTSEFQRSDGSTGKVRRLRLNDDTGQTTLVLWNQRADELTDIDRGDSLRVMDARVKIQPDGRIELHAENATQIVKLTGQEAQVATAQYEASTKIADLREGGPFTVEATVASAPDVREVTTAQNEQVLLASLDLEDDTGKIRMTLWRHHAEQGKELSIGTRIRIKNAYVKRGFSNLLELASRTSTVVGIISRPQTLEA
jgi:replication factor A1